MASDAVLIVGAGMAGLAAARSLHDAGCPVLVLEARHRVGGRVDTRHDPDSPVAIELGAEFVQGYPLRLHEIARRARLLVVELGGDHRSWQHGTFLDSALRRRGHLDEILDRLTAYAGPDQSLERFLAEQGQDPSLAPSAEIAARWVEGYDAAHVDRISTRALARQARAEDAIQGDCAFRIPTGYDGVAHWLQSGLPTVQLGTLVSAVRWQPGQVELTTNVGTFAGRAVVLTVPLPVLRRLPIEPVPKGKAEATAGMHMGSVIKVVLRFTQPFWSDRHPRLGFLQTVDEPFPTWWTSYPVVAPVLVGWSGGPTADALAALDDGSIVERALNSLSRVFQLNAGRLLAAWYLHNWQTDPLAGGAYSYIGVRGLRRQQALAQPVQDTLYYAGEATELEGHHATVHGAIASGERAAREVLSAASR